MRKICAWCKTELEPGPVDGPVSHGICYGCSKLFASSNVAPVTGDSAVRLARAEAELAAMHPLDPRD